MLNLKRRTKPGQCRAMRCTEADLGEGFCERHLEEGRQIVAAERAPVNIDRAAPNVVGKDPVEAAGLQAGFAETSQTEIVPQDAFKQEIESHVASLAETLELIPEFSIVSNDDMNYANELLAWVKIRAKSLEARRKEISQPLNAVLRTYNGWFKKPLDALKVAEAQLKNKIAEALAATKRAQDEALAAVADTGGAVAGEVLAVAHGQELIDQPDNVSIQEDIDFEIVDEKVVPRAFCKPDLAMLKAYGKAYGVAAEVPGVRFFKTRIVKQRAK